MLPIIAASRARLAHLWDLLLTSLWFVPGLMAVLSTVLALVMLRIDAAYSLEWLSDATWIYSRSASGARDLLSTVASTMVTIAGLAFSILVVALQLASTQFGPRLLRNFMGDRGHQIVLGTFIGTFLYCLIVMRTISESDAATPRLSVTLAVPLAVASLGVLIYFLHHAAASMQAPHVIGAVSRELTASIDRLYPSSLSEPAERPPDTVPSSSGERMLVAPHAGYVQRIEVDILLQVATRADAVLRVLCRPGEYVLPDQALLAVAPAPRASEAVLDGARRGVVIGPQRTAAQDVAFTFEQLGQIALRALSPAIDDPFTAVACIDHLSAALDRLIRRRTPPAQRADDRGAARVIAPAAPVSSLVDRALTPFVEAAPRSSLALQRLAATIALLAERATDQDVRAVLAAHAARIARHAAEGLPPHLRDTVLAHCRRAMTGADALE